VWLFWTARQTLWGAELDIDRQIGYDRYREREREIEKDSEKKRDTYTKTEKHIDQQSCQIKLAIRIIYQAGRKFECDQDNVFGRMECKVGNSNAWTSDSKLKPNVL